MKSRHHLPYYLGSSLYVYEQSFMLTILFWGALYACYFILGSAVYFEKSPMLWGALSLPFYYV